MCNKFPGMFDGDSNLAFRGIFLNHQTKVIANPVCNGELSVEVPHGNPLPICVHQSMFYVKSSSLMSTKCIITALFLFVYCKA